MDNWEYFFLCKSFQNMIFLSERSSSKLYEYGVLKNINIGVHILVYRWYHYVLHSSPTSEHVSINFDILVFPCSILLNYCLKSASQSQQNFPRTLHYLLCQYIFQGLVRSISSSTTELYLLPGISSLYCWT